MQQLMVDSCVEAGKVRRAGEAWLVALAVTTAREPPRLQ